MFSEQYPLLTPKLCRAAQRLALKGKPSCIALADRAGRFRYGDLWMTTFRQASVLLQEQGEHSLLPLAALDQNERATTRVMYLELLALAQEDGLL